MSPLQLELFIQAGTLACKVGELPSYRRGTVVHKACLDELESFGLLSLTDGETFEDRRYRATEKGTAYLQFLCCLPLPVSNWTIPGPWAPSFPPEQA